MYLYWSFRFPNLKIQLQSTLEILPLLSKICEKWLKNCLNLCGFSIIDIQMYGDNELCKRTIKVIFMISVDVIKDSEAH